MSNNDNQVFIDGEWVETYQERPKLTEQERAEIVERQQKNGLTTPEREAIAAGLTLEEYYYNDKPTKSKEKLIDIEKPLSQEKRHNKNDKQKTVNIKKEDITKPHEPWRDLILEDTDYTYIDSKEGVNTIKIRDNKAVSYTRETEKEGKKFIEKISETDSRFRDSEEQLELTQIVKKRIYEEHSPDSHAFALNSKETERNNSYEEAYNKATNEIKNPNDLENGRHEINIDGGSKNVFFVVNGRIVDSFIEDKDGVQTEYFSRRELESEGLQEKLTEIIKDHEYEPEDGVHTINRGNDVENKIVVKDGRIMAVSIRDGNQFKEIYDKEDLADPALQYELRRSLRIAESNENALEYDQKVRERVERELDL